MVDMRRLLILAACAFGPLIAGVASTPALATPAPTDVMFVFDTSGSMSLALQEAKGEM
jgi:hypothetical protein